MAHVHANLMRASGKQMTLDERIAVVEARGIKALEHLESRDGLTRKGVIGNRHLHAVARRSGDTGVDSALVHGDVPVNERDIATVECARADEILKRALGVVVFCREHKARGIAIQAMHDAGAVLTLHGTQMVNAAVVDQSVRKRAALVAMGGMAHQAALLGEHDEVVVLVTNIEGNGLRNHVSRIVRLGQVDRDAVTGAHGILF